MVKNFWIVNISKRDVGLSDLGLTVKSKHSINLLDSRHYSLTEEQVLNSVKSGSIYKKRDKILIRNSPLNTFIKTMEVSTLPIKSRARSGISYEEPKYEEHDLSDEAYAEQMADLAEEDRKPIISRDNQ